MNYITQCSQFIANSLKFYDIIRFRKAFNSVFVFHFVNLYFVLIIERAHPIQKLKFILPLCRKDVLFGQSAFS